MRNSVFFVEVGCGRAVSCGFDAFLVEWIPFNDFNKTIFSILHVCTVTVPKYSSGAHNESSLNIRAQNAGNHSWYRPTSPRVLESCCRYGKEV